MPFDGAGRPDRPNPPPGAEGRSELLSRCVLAATTAALGLGAVGVLGAWTYRHYHVPTPSSYLMPYTPIR
jgi:hypothetical protein